VYLYNELRVFNAFLLDAMYTLIILITTSAFSKLFTIAEGLGQFRTSLREWPPAVGRLVWYPYCTQEFQVSESHCAYCRL